MVKFIKPAERKITKTFVYFVDNQAGLRAISHDDLSRRHSRFQLKEPKYHSVLEKRLSPLS